MLVTSAESRNGSGLIAEYLTVFVILAWPEVVLEPPRIHPLVRQGVAAGMAEHVHMNREGKPCGFASSFNQPGNAHTPEGLATLVDEDIRPLARQST